MLRDLYEYYSHVGPCEFLEYVLITLTDKTDPSDPSKRDDYWRWTLCTMASYYLNIADHV